MSLETLVLINLIITIWIAAQQYKIKGKQCEIHKRQGDIHKAVNKK